MKVRDLIAELQRMPLDDDAVARIDLAEGQVVDVAVAEVKRINDHASSVYTAVCLYGELTPLVRVSFLKD